MSEQIQPSDNALATALVIAYEIAHGHGQARQKTMGPTTANDLAKETRAALDVILQGMNLYSLQK